MNELEVTMVKCQWTAAIACALSAALIGAAAGDANVRTPTSGWEWGNPTPQGNSLRALGFVGARGYAAGDFGTVLRTDDAGATWTGLPSGVSASLNLLQVLGPDSFVVGGGCVVRRSDNGGTVFRRVYFVAPSCKEPVSALAFSSSAVGYLALADGTLLRTTDAGASFARGTAVPGTRSSAQAGPATPTDLAFLNDTTGFVATTSGQINVTTDGGGSWKAVIDLKRPVRDITFVDAKRGFAVGDGSLVLRTSDGGETWKPQAIGAPDPIDLASIRCVPGAAAETPASCLAASRKGDVLVRTTDGANTFSIITPSTDPVFAADFASATRIVAGGAAGAVVTSNDGGATFARIGSRLPGIFWRLRSTKQGAAFAAGNDGALARSTDAGVSWSRVDVPTSESLVDVAFASPTTGYALDSDGALFRTSNGGTGWSTLDTGTTAKPTAIDAPTDKRVLLFGPTGIRRSNDGGGRPRPHHRPNRPAQRPVTQLHAPRDRLVITPGQNRRTTQRPDQVICLENLHQLLRRLHRRTSPRSRHQDTNAVPGNAERPLRTADIDKTGENRWPSTGTSHVRHRGISMAARGEKLMAAVTIANRAGVIICQRRVWPVVVVVLAPVLDEHLGLGEGRRTARC